MHLCLLSSPLNLLHDVGVCSCQPACPLSLRWHAKSPNCSHIDSGRVGNVVGPRDPHLAILTGSCTLMCHATFQSLPCYQMPALRCALFTPDLHVIAVWVPSHCPCRCWWGCSTGLVLQQYTSSFQDSICVSMSRVVAVSSYRWLMLQCRCHVWHGMLCQSMNWTILCHVGHEKLQNSTMHLSTTWSALHVVPPTLAQYCDAPPPLPPPHPPFPDLVLQESQASAAH